MKNGFHFFWPTLYFCLELHEDLLELHRFVSTTMRWRRTAESAGLLAVVGDFVQCRVDAFSVVSELHTRLALVVTNAGICQYTQFTVV